MKPNQGSVLDEEFAADITMTLQFPVESMDEFQKEIQELTAGKLRAEVIETKQIVIPL